MMRSHSSCLDSLIDEFVESLGLSWLQKRFAFGLMIAVVGGRTMLDPISAWDQWENRSRSDDITR
jgi:hypothetical protein